MIRSAVTVSLVSAARGGPFVFWDDLGDACRKAAELSFDAIEAFLPGPDAVAPAALQELLRANGLRLAGVGTGAGWVMHKLTLTNPDEGPRQRAREFIRSMIEFGAPFQAPAIIGSMQGRWGDGVSRATALGWLSEALDDLGEHARGLGVRLIYEPLNRYETNLINTVDEGNVFLSQLTTGNVRLLADLFHMNIEEVNIADALLRGGAAIGHVHFVDSNRRPAGLGHMPLAAVASALHEMKYDGYASAEALPFPSPDEAAQQAIIAFRKYFGRPDGES